MSQVGNLQVVRSRVMGICEPLRLHGQPTASRRYSRLPVCATRFARSVSGSHHSVTNIWAARGSAALPFAGRGVAFAPPHSQLNRSAPNWKAGLRCCAARIDSFQLLCRAEEFGRWTEWLSMHRRGGPDDGNPRAGDRGRRFECAATPGNLDLVPVTPN